MCGIVGIYLLDENRSVYPYIVNGLTILQHRGQDAAGIATSTSYSSVTQEEYEQSPKIYCHKNIGKTDKVFQRDMSDMLQGNMGIGHVRYCTAGTLDIESAQPLVDDKTSISIVHNGNLTNLEELSELVQQYNLQLSTTSDSELLLRLLSYCVDKKMSDISEFNIQDAVIYAVNYIMNVCKGSYSVVAMIPGVGLIAFRDPRGIRPLCFGKNSTEDFIFASESVAIQSLGFRLVRDVLPGECIILQQASFTSEFIYSPNPTPCLFEYIYFARPESTMDGILVYQARKNMGESLAKKIKRCHPVLADTIDVVMPVPDSARISALRASYILQKPYCEGLIKNAYVGRTFIMPSQSDRKRTLKMKLNTIDQEFRDKTVLIIDDSIVRGNTSMQIVEIIRTAGAKQIIFASIAPPVRYPNVYGIAIPTESELIASGNKSDEEIARLIGSDMVIYNDLEDVVDSCSKINREIDVFEVSCFRVFT